MGERARVDDQAIGASLLGLEPVDDGALAVGLEGPNLGPEARRQLLDGVQHLGERGRAVDDRLARAEPVQIRAVDEQNPHRGHCIGRL